MAEPRYLEGDDFALGLNQPCDICEAKDGEQHCNCGNCDCGEPDPDTMYNEMMEG